MRALLPLLGLALLPACGPDNEHPPAADPCDPTTMICGKPPMSGSGNGNGSGEGGADSGGDQTADRSGQVLRYTDDYFDDGVVYAGKAVVSANGKSGARVEADYEAASFELEGVLKERSNWFMVVPETGAGALPTITPVDTRGSAGELKIGLASQLLVDGIYQMSLTGSERSDQRAQVVLRVTDLAGRSVVGVGVQAAAEIVLYRSGDAWLNDGVATDDTGMAFLGNVPAGSTLGTLNITLTGAVSARVEATTSAGATTVVTAIVDTP